ncbi:uncharacterized protein LOC103994270 [Musa acuminata AAA Group]|uniref:uncharacterized protein LOC103994270 n=1 Tax=Musa acuminata AAA Group TaxID=214697 RepID=UPI0031D8C7B3
MEGNSWGLAEGELSAAANGRSADWRTQLQPKARQMIVNKILETLKRHLPNSGPEDLNQLRNIAARFEERIFTEADNQSEYLRKISLKLLSMESKTQHSASINTSVSNNNNQNSTDPGTLFTGSDDSDETSGWSLAEGEISAAASGSSADWRTQLQPKARHMIVNQIHKILKRHLPFPEPVDSNILQNVAARLEEAIFNAAHNQSEYLRKISMKMLSVVSETQHSASINTSVSNNNNQNPTDPGTLFTGSDDSDETSGWSLAEGELSTAASGSSADWRTQLQPKARHMIVNQIHEILKRHLPFPEPVDSNILQNVAARLEEAIFNAAHNQSEYLRKISMKMLSVVSETQHSASINTSVSNNNNQNPTDPDC